MKKYLIKNKIKIFGFITLGGVLGIALFLFLTTDILGFYVTFNSEVSSEVPADNIYRSVHIETPEKTKVIYMTACAASTPSFRKTLEQLVEDTEINSIILNVKDETGKIAFDLENPLFQNAIADSSKGECKIHDIKELLEDWHSKGIYIIGRVPVFQDPQLVRERPELAVKKSEGGAIWKDHKGISWLDAGSVEVWDYVIALSKEVYELGFDEINYDYIRFPSDGNMKEIYYPVSEERVTLDPEKGKAKVLQEFFVYLDNKMNDIDAILSVDLFGMVTTNSDDLNIGQILEYALPFFDYVCPMVYPSHYPTGFIGLKNPAAYPYEVIKYSMDFAVKKAIAASSSPDKLRPWLQDFDLGADYDAAKVRAQIQATYDSGLDSWLLWSASNRYTKGALYTE
ncbi:putative glycoside hydrolase [Patescibacteria group bacterium]|nr:putative glycoside hydrolase [Patescibacteria group bacterium]